jgi:hypothetical protein
MPFSSKGESIYNSFFISALAGESGQHYTPGHTLPPGKGPLYPEDMRLGGPQRLEKKSFACAGD